MLNANKFEGGSATVVLQAERDDFTNALHQSVEVLGLSVAAFQDGDSGDIVAIFIAFDDDSKFSWFFHKPILAFHRTSAVTFLIVLNKRPLST